MAQMMSFVTVIDDDGARSGGALVTVNDIPGTMDQVRTALKNSKIKTGLGFPLDVRVKILYIYFCKEGILCI